jgi:hypothetical protein
VRSGISRVARFDSDEPARPVERWDAEVIDLPVRSGWSPENFAREQIRGLVRQVFFTNAARPVRQVVFSAVDIETDVRSICRRVGEALALETAGSVAVVGAYPQALVDAAVPQEPAKPESRTRSTPLRRVATRLRGDLWLVPSTAIGGNAIPASSLHSHLCDLRSEFEYSIVECPPAGASNEAIATAQFADGIILVLSAHRTRPVTARKVMRTLEATQARVLGTVLTDRAFPIPERIYRRL